MKYQKHKLAEKGFDPNVTENEIMKSLGMYRIYDCGNVKYAYGMNANNEAEGK